jgi:hypothetical protein
LLNKKKEFIALHLRNTVGDFCKTGASHLVNGIHDPAYGTNTSSQTCDKLIEFLTPNLKWIHTQIQAHDDDPYWHQVNLIMTQFYGLYHGFYGLDADLTTSVLKNRPLEHIIDDIKPFMDLL